jgi:hypothetical protein
MLRTARPYQTGRCCAVSLKEIGAQLAALEACGLGSRRFPRTWRKAAERLVSLPNIRTSVPDGCNQPHRWLISAGRLPVQRSASAINRIGVRCRQPGKVAIMRFLQPALTYWKHAGRQQIINRDRGFLSLNN